MLLSAALPLLRSQSLVRSPSAQYEQAMRKISSLCFCVALLFGATIVSPARAQSSWDWRDGFSFTLNSGDRLNLIASPFTLHFRPSDEHKHVWLIGVDRERESGALSGVAYFSNSFGQSSVYVFPWGQVYRGLFDKPQIYAKWTAGLLYGYTGKYKDKVPFNHGGFSPGFVPALGWEFDSRQQIQVNLLGFNGLMLQFTQPLR